MRGVLHIAALSAALAFAVAEKASAGEAQSLRALLAEKTATVELLKARGAAQTAQLAQDRLFIAYLNATTQGEGARLRARMEGVLTTIIGRYGMSHAVVVDRTGDVVVRAGSGDETTKKYDVKRNPLMLAGFGAKAKSGATKATKTGLSHVAPVTWRGENEFVLAAEQGFDAYREALTRHVDSKRYVVLTDTAGAILADTRKGAAKSDKIVAGLSLSAMKRAVKGEDAAGDGEVRRGSDIFNVIYQSTGEWTVVAVERVPPPYRCDKNGDRLCG